MKRVILTEAKLRKLMVEMRFSQDIVFVSYLPERFNKNSVRKPEEDTFWNKVYGGLWACPMDSNRSWKEYTKTRPSLNVDNLYAFYFRLKPNVKIYSIDGFDDLSRISTYDFDGNSWYNGIRAINFQYLLENGYDGIYVSEKALDELEGIDDGGHHGLSIIPGTNGVMGLNGWDVESICVFNPEAIIPISEGDADDINYSRFGDVKYTPEKGLESRLWQDDDEYYDYDYDTNTERSIDDDEEIQKKASWNLLDAYGSMTYKSPPTDAYMQARKYDDTNKAWKEHEKQEKKRKAAEKRSMTNMLKSADKKPLIQKMQ